MAGPKRDVHRSPITDPRALGGSAVFHGLLLLLLSLYVLSAIVPSEPKDEPRALRGELGPVDNRAEKDGEGGGSPGELGGTDAVRLSAESRSAEAQALRDPVADALVSEALPTPPAPDEALQDLPGPLTTGVGMLPGPGAGGGGGRGGGSGGGIGRGVGPGTEFFGAREHAGSFAYVIDCSGSMHQSLPIAKRELLASLNQLPPDALFGVIFYNIKSFVFSDPQGREGLMPATAANKARVNTLLSTIKADAGTDHMEAIRAALALHPEVIFFLTDADLMSQDNVNEILSTCGKTRIHTVKFDNGPDTDRTAPLQRLAAATGGTYRYVDVYRFLR